MSVAEHSPALAPPPGNPRFPLLDSCRGAAALAVIVVHTSGVTVGVWANLVGELQSAVQLFFALSGFLLFRPYVSAWAAGESPPRARDFLQRRALRVLPGYWFALTLAALLLGPRLVPGALSAHWWIYYGFLQVYTPSRNLQGIGPAWTLCVEVTFYLLLPALAVIIGRLVPRVGWRRASLSVVGVLLLAGPLVHLLNATPLSHPVERVFVHLAYTLPGEINYFAGGMLLAVASVHVQHGGELPRRLRRLADRPGDAWSLALLMYILAAVLGGFSTPLALPGVGTLDFRTRFVANDLLVWLLVVLLMMPAVFPSRRRCAPQRLLAARPLIYAGVVSYGLYLWHVPLGSWALSHFGEVDRLPLGLAWPARATIVTLVAVVAGTISYRLVELPFLRLKSGWRPGRVRGGRGAEPEPLVGAPHTV